MNTITMKPGDALFIGPPGDKKRAYAHLGHLGDKLIVVNDPYLAYHVSYTTPFTYGNGLTVIPIDCVKVGQQFEVDCWALDPAAMFVIANFDPNNQTVVIQVQDAMAVFQPEESDKPVAAAL